MLLDTTVLIDALRGQPATLARIRRAGPPFLTSAICIEEVLAWARPGEEERVAQLVDSLEHVSVGSYEARVAASWRRSYRRQGITLKQSDCLIAACAAVTGVSLATANIKDFPMPELHVEHWPSE